MGASLFARTGPAGQALSPFPDPKPLIFKIFNFLIFNFLIFFGTGPAGQALSPLSPEGKGDLGESGGAPLQVKRGRGSFRKTFFYDNCWSFMALALA